MNASGPRPETFVELLPPSVGHNLRHFGPETHHVTGPECHCRPQAIPHAPRPTGPGTSQPRRARAVRVEDDLWERARAKADQRGEVLSEEVRKFLARYVAKK